VNEYVGHYVVWGRRRPLGVLEAVLWQQRLLRVRDPRAPHGIVFVPFEAIERIDPKARVIQLRPAREALELAGRRSAAATPATLVGEAAAATLSRLDAAASPESPQ
jgi:hypothetical protein